MDGSVFPAATASPVGVSMKLQLTRSPFAGEVFVAEELIPSVALEQDYCTAPFWEVGDKPPVLLSCSQNFRLLADLVTTAMRMFDGLSHIFVGYWKRSMKQAPAVLMDPRVLLLNHPEQEVARLIRAGRTDIMIIKDNMGVTGREVYDNSFEFALHGSRWTRQDLDAFVDATPLRDAERL